jgi:hypothetical protein
MITSKATTHDTQNYCERFPGLLHKQLGKTGLMVSACGFGCYRVDYRVREHFEAMEHALLNGINLLDTSSNYSDGGSEILIGNVLQKLIENGKLRREEIVIVSKGGYIQGSNYERAKQRETAGNPYKEVVEYSEGLWHSIHPGFIEEQITISLERLRLETIDVYLLHNPEYFLDSPLAKELDLNELRHEYYRRIKKAFEYLEKEVSNGRTSCYGVSSNSFVYKSDEQTFTSLEECVKAANEITADNHFYVVQFPFNLYERGALLNKNQNGGTQTLLEFAGLNNFGVLVNRPLNAIMDKRLNRLADFEVSEEYLKLDQSQIAAEINLLDSMEEDFLKDYLEVLNLSEQNKEAVMYFLKAGQLLKENWKNFGSIESFNDVKKQFLIPRVNYAFSTMLKSSNMTGVMKNRLDKIARQVNKLMGIIETIYGIMANTRSETLHKKLNKFIDQEKLGQFDKLSLSQKSILLINSLQEVSCTLVGMRQKKYVEDVIGSLSVNVIENAKDILMKSD